MLPFVIEVTMDGSVMEIDEHQQRVTISMLIKQSKLMKNSKATITTDRNQRLQYCAVTDVTGRIEEEQVDERGNGDSLTPKYVQVGAYRVNM